MSVQAFNFSTVFSIQISYGTYTRTLTFQNVISIQALTEGCTRLHLRCPAVAQAIYAKKARGVAAFIYLQYPGVSAMEWHPFTVSGLVWPDTQSSTGADTELRIMDQGRAQGSNVQGAGVEPRKAPPDGVTVHIKSMGPASWSDRLYLDALEKQVCPEL